MQQARVLIIEDEEDLSDALKALLEPFYLVQSTTNGLSGLKAALRDIPNLILLDLKMPKMDGFETCKILRTDEELATVPIFVISGYGGHDDRLRAFELGANEFITKPFDGDELLTLIKKTLDKTLITAPEGDILDHGGIRIDLAKQNVRLNDQEIHFSQTEFRLLYLLAANLNKIVSRELILAQVWGQQSISPRVIDAHIFSIRDKTKSSKIHISSVYGKGYILKVRN